jgi:hypothetical protein
MLSPRRTFLALLFASTVACSAAVAPGGQVVETPQAGDTVLGSTLGRRCGLPRKLLLSTWRGFHPQRSGNLQLVPRAPNHIGKKFPHSGPWDFLQEVPMLWYGPGVVPATGKVRRPVTMADVAPTIADLIGFPFAAPDGKPMVEALAMPDTPPRLVLTVVWDGGGRNVLAEYPDAWPNLRRMIRKGVWFERAKVGSSQTVTPPIHTTLGTGAFPRRHGIVDLLFEVDGRLVPAFEEGPQHLLVQTLADRYDLALGNTPEIGVVAFREWHLGMIGHGSALPGADRDLAVTLDRRTGRWVLKPPNDRFYEFAAYANDVPGRERYLRQLDLEDGRQDGSWLGESVLLDPEFPPKTPAYTRWQTRILQEIIRREGFGADDVPDLLFTNYKQIDEVSHRWSMNSPQMEAVVRSTDQALGDLERILDRSVGKGRWAMVVTADHGSTPKAELSGAIEVEKWDLMALLEARFGDGDDREVVTEMRPAQAWIDLEELRDQGATLEEVAEFLRGFRVNGKRFFSAVFPAEALTGGSCGERPGSA